MPDTKASKDAPLALVKWLTEEVGLTSLQEGVAKQLWVQYGCRDKEDLKFLSERDMQVLVKRKFGKKHEYLKVAPKGKLIDAWKEVRSFNVSPPAFSHATWSPTRLPDDQTLRFNRLCWHAADLLDTCRLRRRKLIPTRITKTTAMRPISTTRGGSLRRSTTGRTCTRGAGAKRCLVLKVSARHRVTCGCTPPILLLLFLCAHRRWAALFAVRYVRAAQVFDGQDNSKFLIPTIIFVSLGSICGFLTTARVRANGAHPYATPCSSLRFQLAIALQSRQTAPPSPPPSYVFPPRLLGV